MSSAITSYTAQELEAFAANPKTRPSCLSSQDLEALLIGHPLTKLPTYGYKRTADFKSGSRVESLNQLAAVLFRLSSRLILVYLLLMAFVTFAYSLVSQLHDGHLLQLFVDGKENSVSIRCIKHFDAIPVAAVCHAVLALTCLGLLFLSIATDSWAVQVTDYILQRTITTAASHVVRRIQHLYGLLQTINPSEVSDINQPISYHLCRWFESCLRSRLSMILCNSVTVLVCLLCLVFAISNELLLLRWQILTSMLSMTLFCCLLSNSLRRVHWFKVFHLFCLAMSLLFVSRFNYVNHWLNMIWMMPLKLVHSMRSIEVFNRTIESLDEVLVMHDQHARYNWFYFNVQRVAVAIIMSFLLRLFNSNRRLNLFQVLFRYNFLLEPVESVTLLVALCNLPPVTSVLLLSSQLKLMTASEMDSLLLIGTVQSLFTSCRPVIRMHADFINNSKFLCILVPLCTVCAAAVVSIVSPCCEQSRLLLHSQRMCRHRRQFGRGIRRMLIKQTRTSCRLLMLLVVAHELRSRILFLLSLGLSFKHSGDLELHNWLHSATNVFLLVTGSHLKADQNVHELLFSGRVNNDKLVQADILTHSSYPMLLNNPSRFISNAIECNVWSIMSMQIANGILGSTMPLLSSVHEHSIFLMLLRLSQNGFQEVGFFICTLLVNLDGQGKQNLLISMFRLGLALLVTVAFVFGSVNFVSSIEFIG